MAKKKVEKKEPELICLGSFTYDGQVPEGATWFETELDYSTCWYESDRPSAIVKFYKRADS